MPFFEAVSCSSQPARRWTRIAQWRREVTEIVGVGQARDLEFVEMNPDGFDHVLAGGERFDIPRGKEIYADRLKSRFPASAAAIDRYLHLVSRLASELDAGLDLDTPGGVLGPAFLLRAPTVLRHGMFSLNRLFDHAGVKEPLLRAILA